MLGRIHGSVEHLYVPHLIPLPEKGEVLFGKPTRTKHHQLYRLDWDKVDGFKRDEFMNWARRERPDFTDEVELTLPKQFDGIVKSLVFAVPSDYIDEIHHFGQLYINERHRQRSFDTCIREMCLSVSTSAINCAFKLIGDCIYDQENKTWFRENDVVDKRLLRHLMMYKFWRRATGDALVWQHAELDELEDLATRLAKDEYHTGRKMALLWLSAIYELRRFEDAAEQSKQCSSGLYYATQLVEHEHLAVGKWLIHTKLSHTPVVLGTAVLNVSVENKRILQITFGSSGKPESVIKNSDRPKLEQAKLDHAIGEIMVLVDSFQPNTVATISYEYNMDLPPEDQPPSNQYGVNEMSFSVPNRSS